MTEQDNIVPLYLPVRAACLLTGLGRSTIYEAARTGDLPSLKVAGRRLFRRADLIAWMEAGHQEAA